MKQGTPPASYPYLTSDIPGLHGVYKQLLEDFLVEEIPPHAWDNKGEVLCFQIEKKGLSTHAALKELSQQLQIPHKSLGFAGLKDAQAATRQWISATGCTMSRLKHVQHPKLRVLEVAKHTAMLKLGDLAGNRFRIRLREIRIPSPQAVKQAREVLSILTQKGVPNYFGPQRFGTRNDTQRLGEAALHDHVETFMDLLLGGPNRMDNAIVYKARQFYQQNRFLKAYHCWLPSFSLQRQALDTLLRKHGNKRQAYQIVDAKFKFLCVSAYQSDLFNRVLAARMPRIDQLLPGDIAYRHDLGECFPVNDPQQEQARCDRFEISPTGPLWGFDMAELTGDAAQYENPILAQASLTKQELKQSGRFHLEGGRRPLRFQPQEATAKTAKDRHGPYLQLNFTLPPGCYATSLLREICKTDPASENPIAHQKRDRRKGNPSVRKRR